MSRETLEHVGALWIQCFEQRRKGRVMEKYWEEQHKNPRNDRGNPFDSFSEMLMPCTLSDEEIQQIRDSMPDGYEEMMANMLDVKTFPGCLYEEVEEYENRSNYVKRGT